MPLYNYGRVPGYTPGGRYIGTQGWTPDVQRANDILHDVTSSSINFQPSKYSQAEINWANQIVGANEAPTINQKRLASAPGISNPLDAFAFGVQKFGRAPAQSSIDAFNNKYGTSITANQLLNYPKVNANAINAQNSFSINNSVDDLTRRQGEVDALAAGKLYNPTVTNPDAMASLFRNQFGSEMPALNSTTVLPSGRTSTTALPTPTLNFQSVISPDAKVAGTLGSFGQQWNEQNDPGGFIRKFQQQQANQPWTPGWGNPGNIYGIGGGSRKL